MKRRRWIALGLLTAAACHSPSALGAWERQVGDAPNLVLPTLGGAQLWADVAWRDDWRVQRHTWSGHHRLLDPDNRRRAWGTRARCEALLRERATPEPEGTHLVLLLHGLGRTRRSLAPMERALEDEGWQVVRLSYPSARASIEQHAADVAAVLASLEGVRRVSFVTHSLGGLVAREVLADPDAPWRRHIEPRCLVQLAPPNQGAELARRLDFVPVRLLMGPSFATLADPEGVNLPQPNLPVAVVTGSGGGNPMITGPNDLVVGVREAQLDGATTLVLPGALHTFIMNDPRAIEGALAALDATRQE